jgi:AraC-like DNA-binding protein
MNAWRDLLRSAERWDFAPHNIAAQLDGQGHYHVQLDDEFPLLIKLFHYSSRHHTRGGTWHERLELFVPLDGAAHFRMGEQEVELEAGDLLVVDNLKLHQVVDFPGFNTRVIVISFLPEFVYSLGSPSHDYAFLMPFYSKLEHRPHVVRARTEIANEIYISLRKLLECYFTRRKNPLYQAGCKAFLLELLYSLAVNFRNSEVLKWQFMKQQESSLRLKKLFEHIRTTSTERLSIQTAARIVGMNPPQFMKTFKKVSGMTLVAYLNHVRLRNAAHLLRETDRSIADIANASGFSDQSYFDRRFKRAFGQTPKEFRAKIAAAAKS